MNNNCLRETWQLKRSEMRRGKKSSLFTDDQQERV